MVSRFDVKGAATEASPSRTRAGSSSKAAASGLQATDDVSLIEAIGGSVAVVMGSSTNIKITQAADLALAEQLWSQQPSH